MIKTFQAKNYGCLKDVTAALTPLHAFIGPNDSGKSTLLRGLRTVVQLAGGRFRLDDDDTWTPFDPLLWEHTQGRFELVDPTFELGCSVSGGAYAVRPGGVLVGQEHRLRLTEIIERPEKVEQWPLRAVDEPRDLGTPLSEQLRAARLVRFDPDALRSPSGLIPETAPVGFYDDRGLGLAGVYFAIRNRDDDAFSSIVQEVRRHFPTIKGIRVKAVTRSEVVLEADLTSGAKIEARRMSEGLLYYLAFAALRHLDPVSLLLVEEPENGLHPARIGEVVRVLRTIVEEQGTQVVMATHSPLVINEMQPDEVTVVTRADAEGTKLTPMKDTANFAKQSSVYALGELWLSFADGIEEAPLLRGRAAS